VLTNHKEVEPLLMDWKDHYVLHMGCGLKKMKNGVNVDINPDVEPDKIYDLNKTPFPWSDNTFHRVIMAHVLEHLGDPWAIKMTYAEWFFKFWHEVWRVLKPNGIVEVIVPYYNHESAWGDPSHVRPIMAQTFIFLSKKEYAKAKAATNNPMAQYDIDFDFDILGLQVVNDESAQPVVVTATLKAIKE